MFMQQGAYVGARSSSGQTALDLAIKHKRTQVAALLQGEADLGYRGDTVDPSWGEYEAAVEPEVFPDRVKQRKADAEEAAKYDQAETQYRHHRVRIYGKKDVGR